MIVVTPICAHTLTQRTIVDATDKLYELTPRGEGTGATRRRGPRCLLPGSRADLPNPLALADWREGGRESIPRQRVAQPIPMR